ncbi:MAG: sigma-70 family RNA polymerase sigma factor [Polyangiaceae bacterium]|nr:sigma-70 family RNA polymerase sigma factor [Polyangiaceae bacterium]
MDLMGSKRAVATHLRLVGGEAQATRPASPSDGLGDPELVALARDGHQRAFESLYRRHAGFALNLAVRIQGHAQDVEDIVHDAFLRAHGSLAELRDAASFRPWLGSIVVSLVRTRMRKRRLLGVLGFGGQEAVDLEAVAAPDAGPEARAQLAQIYALLCTLPSDERIAWTLRNVEHHQLETVASLTDCSLATAKRRIARAQRFLDGHFVAPFAEDKS